MGKFSEALHPRGFGGKFSKKGGGGKSKGLPRPKSKALGSNRTLSRQERKVKASKAYDSFRAAGASRGEAKGAKRTQKLMDKGHVVSVGGQMAVVRGGGKKTRREVAAHNKNTQLGAMRTGGNPKKAVKGYRSAGAKKRAVARNHNDRQFSKGAKPVRAYKTSKRIAKRQARIKATKK